MNNEVYVNLMVSLEEVNTIISALEERASNTRALSQRIFNIADSQLNTNPNVEANTSYKKNKKQKKGDK